MMIPVHTPVPGWDFIYAWKKMDEFWLNSGGVKKYCLNVYRSRYDDGDKWNDIIRKASVNGDFPFNNRYKKSKGI